MTTVPDDSVRGREAPIMIAFGPVPSRRLGRSLGINNIPYKICTYSCVYCQVGRTLKFRLEPSAFYEPEVIAREVGEKMEVLRVRAGFVPEADVTTKQSTQEGQTSQAGQAE